jgi:hypothetical protein
MQAQFEEVFKRNPDAVRYQIIDGELYRVVGLDGEAAKCKHKERCEGIEFAILKVRNVAEADRRACDAGRNVQYSRHGAAIPTNQTVS